MLSLAKLLPLLALLCALCASANFEEIGKDITMLEEYGTVIVDQGKQARLNSAMSRKVRFWEGNKLALMMMQDYPSVLGSPQTCTNGIITLGGTDFPCNKVDFLSVFGRADLKVERTAFSDSSFQMTDIWGWRSPTGREVTLSGMSNVLWFIDSTDPVNPKRLGYIESHREESFWDDVKVYKDVAYIVQDGALNPSNKGIQVVDLMRLETEEVLNSPDPVNLAPDFTYAEHGPAHNIVVDTESGFIYSVGLFGGNNCNAGLHVADLNQNKLQPVFAGCAGQDGYVHDAQCVVYTGPDATYQGKQLCFGYNADALTIYDVTDKSNMTIISSTGYPNSGYVHQGWLNADMDFLLLDDEADEGGDTFTKTYIFDVTSLQNPSLTGIYEHPTQATDHNLYFFGVVHAKGWGGNPPVENPPSLNYAYLANYDAGLRVLDTTGIKQDPPVLKESGFFNSNPESETNGPVGAWSSYMHPSGVIALNVIDKGVFFLNFTDAFVEPGLATDPPAETMTPTQSPVAQTEPPVPETNPPVTATEPPVSEPSPGDDDEMEGDILEVVVIITIVVLVIAVIVLLIALVKMMPKIRRSRRAVVEDIAAADLAEGKKVMNPMLKA